jgi:lipopolysaccharide export system permease protein
MPLVFAIIFFLVFYLLNAFGEKFSKDNVLSPFMGMWLSAFVLIPVGAFLTYKAMHVSQLFNKEYYYRSIKKIKAYINRFRNEK